jgi:transcriptional regulator of acetoin/glycerol metabolism
MEALLDRSRYGMEDPRVLRDQLVQVSRKVVELEAELSRLRTVPGPVGAVGTEAPTFETMRLNDVEGVLVKKAMQRFRGNVSQAARALGLSRSALYRRLQRHGL